MWKRTLRTVTLSRQKSVRNIFLFQPTCSVLRSSSLGRHCITVAMSSAVLKAAESSDRIASAVTWGQQRLGFQSLPPLQYVAGMATAVQIRAAQLSNFQAAPMKQPPTCQGSRSRAILMPTPVQRLRSSTVTCFGAASAFAARGAR